MIIKISEENFEQEVLQSKQPVVVDFWAEWCPPCKALTPVLDEIAQSYSGRAKIAKVNVDENANLSQRFGIRSIPTLLYFNGGELRRQTIGAVNRKRIIDDLEAVGVI